MEKEINIYVFDESLEKENVINFIKETEEKISKENHNILYFSCQGGTTFYSILFQDYISRTFNEIIAFGELMSSGLDVFLNCQISYKNILPDSYGMTHKGELSEIPLDMNLKPKLSKDELKILKEPTYADVEMKNRLKKLSPKLLKRYEKGEDIYFTSSEIRLMLCLNAEVLP